MRQKLRNLPATVCLEVDANARYFYSALFPCSLTRLSGNCPGCAFERLHGPYIPTDTCKDIKCIPSNETDHHPQCLSNSPSLISPRSTFFRSKMFFSKALAVLAVSSVAWCTPMVSTNAKRDVPSAFTDGITNLGQQFDTVNTVVNLFVSTWGSNMTVQYGNEIVWALQDVKTAFDTLVTNVGNTSTFVLTSDDSDQVKASLNGLAAKVQAAIGPFPGIRNKVGAAGGPGLVSAIYSSLSTTYTIFIPTLPNYLITWAS
ncbi:hypothetical protein CPB83DRAFT_841896 [Crepidotus variabilis]|uniref:Uncharacterized protein n=1 Tax=Crepidotus variabilis TaxID=179855 RepID=A0A9P6JVJ6_9AGAR|nr:hypothetical protein CPB83DRAFT_841896 [Crepidotus variabilis]